MKLKKKIVLTILVIVVLGIIAAIITIRDSYKNSEKGITNKYMDEVADVLTLDEKRKCIVMYKKDITKDGVDDYVGITGIEKFEDENKEQNQASQILKEITKSVELYQELEVVLVDGSTHEIKKYQSEKTFYPEVKLSLQDDEKNSYVFVSDESSGNVLLLIYKDGEFKNIIKDSISSDFNGYTITAKFDEETKNKIKVNLDNYARSYLSEQKDEKDLTFENENITEENYRATYLANKFCSFKLEDIDNDNILDLVGVQNILYLLDDKKESNTLPKMAGVVNTVFKIEDNTVKFNLVEVKEN